MGKIQVNTTYLNHDWTFVKGFEPSYLNTFPKGDVIQIPHTVRELPFNNFSELEYQFISSYHKTFTMEKDKHKRYLLHFDGVMAYCEVYLNKQRVMTHKGGYTPFKADVTKLLKSGENSLVVMVDSHERPDIPPFGFVVDYLTYGGIYRDVYLEEQPENFIDHALVDVKNDQINIRMFLDVTKPTDTVFVFNLYKNNQLAYFFEREYDLKKKDITVTETVYLDPWTLEEPTLYELEIKIHDQTIYRSRFGNRQVAFTTKGFYLNGEPIKLVGLNRHQAYPYVGYAMPSSAQALDADLLKYELGVNIVRSSHYPPSRYFLDRCDEIGLLVFDEIPGWQHIGDDKWKDVAYQDVREMILRDYNHPSVVIWGVRINESPDDDPFYLETNRIAQLLDTSRPTGGVRNFPGSNLFENVYTYNDFIHRGDNQGLAKPSAIAKKQVPYLVTEYNGHMFPTKSYDDEAHRIEHVNRHLAVQDASFERQEISGAIGWCMNDYNTHKDFGSGDRVCYHGVMDMFRIPKDAAYVYKSIGDTKPFLHVTSNMHIGDRAAGEIKEVMILSNVDYVKFYINDDYIGEYYPDRERYPHVPHPPIIIDDFIGQLIHDKESFSEKDADTVKDILLYIMKHGMKLPLMKRLKMGLVLFKYKLSIDQAAKLYEKYVGKWGLESLTYKFEGYVDQLVAVTKTVGPSHHTELVVETTNTSITETNTYETARVVIRLIDHHGNTRRYAHDVVKLSTTGAIAIIGPSDVALQGGVIAVYVKSTGKAGKGVLNITSPRFGKQSVSFTVK